MLIARWQIDARFGHKQTVIDLAHRWMRDIGSKAGADEMNVQILTGSIGAREATVEINHTVESLAHLERFFEAIGKIEAHKQWSKDMEPLCRVGLGGLDDLPGAVTVYPGVGANCEKPGTADARSPMT